MSENDVVTKFEQETPPVVTTKRKCAYKAWTTESFEHCHYETNLIGSNEVMKIISSNFEKMV